MKQRMWIAALVAAAVAVPAHAQPSPPQPTYELVIEGLSNKVTLELSSWSFGVYDESTTEETAGKPRGLVVQDLYVVITQTPDSALLLDALVSRKVMSKVTLRMKGDKDKVFEIAMKDVRISYYNTGGYHDMPTEQLSFRYDTAKMTLGPKGKTESAAITRPRTK